MSDDANPGAILREVLAAEAPPLEEAALAALELHLVELLRWRERADLTSITDPRTIAIRHYLDSLLLAPDLPDGARVADLGCGAGFPGVPLAAARPDVHVLLVETRSIKATFLQHALSLGSLTNAEVLKGRAERLAGQHGPVDRVVARALAQPDAVRRLAQDWLVPGGRLLVMRGPDRDGEAPTADEPWDLEGERTYELPLERATRRVVTYRRR